jgi:hypothetical protein
MANIACFGCSWTHGATFEIGVNWVNALAKLMPEHTFFNLSQAGSSLLHSIWIHEMFTKHYKPDFTIFQITTEGRKTYYLNDKVTDHSFLFGPDFLRGHDDIPNLKTLCLPPEIVQSVNYGTLFRENAAWDGDPYFKRRYDFAKIYYETFDRMKTFDLEHKIFSQYVHDNADLAFFHNLDSVPADMDLESILCIEHKFGKEKFLGYSSDGIAFHLTTEGCYQQALLIKSLIHSPLVAFSTSNKKN